MKYIILKEGIIPEEPIIFAKYREHLDMANKFGGPQNVESAGFVEFDKMGKASVWGHSQGLKIGARKEDAHSIDKMNNF